jgi:sarcosine oxidase subunit beta
VGSASGPSGLTADVAVVGAGIIGLSVALNLSARGLRVVILERSGVGAGQSGVQPGGVRQQWSTRVNCEMARESIAFYSELDARLEPSVHPVLHHCGYLFVAESDDLLGPMAAEVELQRSCGIPSQLVSATEAAEIVPGLDGTAIRGGTWCAEDGYFDRPQTVVEAFAEAAQREGATLHIAEATNLTRDGDSWRLSLRGGNLVSAEHVVIAAGYDTPPLLDGIGAQLPIDREPRYLFFSDAVRERLLEPLVVAPERQLAAKQLASGRVIVSDLSARGDPQANENAWRRNVRAGARVLLPFLEHLSFPLLVEGHYDITPDHNAILGEVEDRVWVAAGFSGHGFMMAPATGRALAAAICGDERHRWLDELSPARFAGSDLKLEARIV